MCTSITSNVVITIKKYKVVNSIEIQSIDLTFSQNMYIITL
jgi:hypothetical protein